MKRVIISGGGTGGHIFPAIAIANTLKAKVEGIEILFIGARGRMEMEKVPAAGFRIEGLTISGFQRRLTWKNLTFPFKVINSLLKARRIIKNFKPDLVIGVGGYASGPTLRMATSMGIPTLIQEQNSFPGVTNRLLATRVRKICVAYEGMSRYFPEEKLVLTGNPIRQEMVLTAGKREEALKFFGLDAKKKTLLVIGGSLGARTINQAILKFVSDGGNSENIQIVWQTGKYYFENINANIPHPVSRIPYLVILPFIDRMDLAYAVADFIVSRAGAIAISELCIVGKPLILVPSPNVSEDHQTKNARALADKNAAILITDATAVETLGKAIMDLSGNPALQADLSAGIKALGILNSAEKIAEVAISMMNPPAETPHPAAARLQPRSVYFLGIGGIGMSALARFFLQQGSSVAGYDRTPTPLTDQMTREGMKIHFTEDSSLIPPKPDLVIYTPAVPVNNLEYQFFKNQEYPMRKRAEVLGMISGGYKTIAVAGTHGKTTTSTLIAHMLHTAGMRQIAFLGGVSKNYGTNYLNEAPLNQAPATGGSPATITYCVVEADEYDKSFLQLSPWISIITSADADHLDIYGSHDDLRKTFSAFTARMVTGGSLIIKAGVNVTPKRISDYTVYDYSITGGAAFSATDIRLINGLLHFDFVSPSGILADLVLGVPGKFNLENAISALAVGTLLGISATDLRTALLTYEGVVRRFEVRIRRPDLVYIDDYAHHPEELKACIGAVRDLYPGKRITGIFQPHLFTRTRDLADDFARSLEMLDELLLLDIYPARELPIEGIDSQFLLDRVNLQHKKVIGKNRILDELAENKPEILLTLGAGDIDQLTQPITNALSLPA